MHTTKITRTLALARFAPAGKPSRTYCGLLPVLALCAATAIALPAQNAPTFTTLVSFDSTDSASPAAVLVQGTDGNLYRTTYDGGANGLGTFFKMALVRIWT